MTGAIPVSTISNADICILCDKKRFEHKDHLLCTNVVESVLGLQEFNPVNNMERMLARTLVECQKDKDRCHQAHVREVMAQMQRAESAERERDEARKREQLGCAHPWKCSRETLLMQERYEQQLQQMTAENQRLLIENSQMHSLRHELKREIRKRRHCQHRCAVLRKAGEHVWQQLQQMTAALNHLVTKLDEVHENGEYKSVWIIAQLHRGPYSGPKYDKELNDARALLSGKGE